MSKAKARKRSSSDAPIIDLDTKKAYEDALNHVLVDEVWINPKMKAYIEANATCYAVDPKMIIPSFLVATSNAMGKATLQFGPKWKVTSNIYVLVVAAKGAGKSHASKTFLAPLGKLEKAEMAKFDEKKTTKKKNNKEGDNEEAVDGDGEQPRKKKKEKEADTFRFHPKTRIVDQITPEALIMSLKSGDGVLVIVSDEFKGFYSKMKESSTTQSAICSAFTSESIKYTTIKHGSIEIDEARLSIFGAVQAEALVEMLNTGDPDHQGFWDRILLIPAAKDYSVTIDMQLAGIPEDVDMDMDLYIKTLHTNHKTDRIYKVSEEALTFFKECKTKLDELDAESNYSNEVSGVTQKAYAILQKTALIYCAARETLEMMEFGDDGGDQEVKCVLEIQDVKAGWSLVQLSIEALKSFKVAIKQEFDKGDDDKENEGMLKEEEVTEDLIWAGDHKIKLIYEKSDDNNEILVSVMKRDKLFPAQPRVDVHVFVEALCKFGIAEKGMRVLPNKRTVPMIVLTMQERSNNPDIYRMFRLLFQRLKEKKIKFDPLDKFSED